MENIKERFDLTEVTDEFVNEVLPNAEELDLTVSQIKVLALLRYISRIDRKDKDGYFFVENDFIRKVCKIGSKSTLNNAFGVLVESGYIERISGKKKVKGEKIVTSKYKVNCTTKPIENQQVIESVQPKCTSNCTTNCTVELELDKELDIEKDIYNIIINKINNIIKENNNKLINIIEEKENNIINNIIKEKEKSSSIENNTKENNTQMEKELQEQINNLEKQNEILTSRLNNCGRQFKAMMNVVAELQQEINELKKENKTSSELDKVNKKETPTINVIVEPSTALIEQDDTVNQLTENKTVEVKKEVFQSPIEELNATFDAEAIVEEFKENYTDAEEAQVKQIELIKTFKKAGLNYYNRCELEHRISKYIKSLELINSTAKEVVPTEDVNQVQEELPQEAIKEAEEVIESRKEDNATEEKESTFVGNFQTNEGNSSIGEETLRYQDVKTKAYYPTLDAAQAANVNPIFLYDSIVGRCVSSYH